MRVGENWLGVTAMVTARAVVAGAIAVGQRARQSRSHSRIADGFYLGGRIAELPPGTRATLNPCEWEDLYRAEEHRAARDPVPERPLWTSNFAKTSRPGSLLG
jgi:hypothetical protein